MQPIRPAASYTLAELSAEVALRLAADGIEAAEADGRVSPAPDARTIRYYTTLGLLDHPLEVRNRQARYGERHVLQAVAVKALQSTGHNLAHIQVALAGLNDAELVAVARQARSNGQDAGSRAPARRFWAPASQAVPRPASPASAPAMVLAASSPHGTTPPRSTPPIDATAKGAEPAGQAATGQAGTGNAATRNAATGDGATENAATGDGATENAATITGAPVGRRGPKRTADPRFQTTIPLAPGMSLVLDGLWQVDARSVVALAEPLIQALSASAPKAESPARAADHPTAAVPNHIA